MQDWFDRRSATVAALIQFGLLILAVAVVLALLTGGIALASMLTKEMIFWSILGAFWLFILGATFVDIRNDIIESRRRRGKISEDE